MRIGLFSPYLPEHFGGGEKYILDVARLWAKDHDVEVGIADLDISQAASIRQKYERFLGQPLDKVTFVSCPLHTPASWLQKILWTKKYDVLFYVTDGSQFFSLAGRNI